MLRRPSSSVRRPSVHNVQTFSPLEPTGKFHVAPPREGGTKGGTKDYINGQGHMTEMAATPINGKKNFKNLLQNQRSNDLKTWHIASGTSSTYYINDDPGLTLTFLRQGQIWLLMQMNGEICYKVI